MIFVTVGTQLPFERLAEAVDAWAAGRPARRVFMQLGETAYRPRHCEFSAYTPPAEWERLFDEAELVVSHAGMGTILKSLERAKPLVIMPRLAALGEHRNDHQQATARRLGGLANLRVVNDAGELAMALDVPPGCAELSAQKSSPNLDRLIREIRQFIAAGEKT